MQRTILKNAQHELGDVIKNKAATASLSVVSLCTEVEGNTL